jgi:hypothetical protein
MGVGLLVRDNNDEVGMIIGITKPHKPSSTGRVYVKWQDENRGTGEYFPSVFGLYWVDREDRP